MSLERDHTLGKSLASADSIKFMHTIGYAAWRVIDAIKAVSNNPEQGQKKRVNYGLLLNNQRQPLFRAAAISNGISRRTMKGYNVNSKSKPVTNQSDPRPRPRLWPFYLAHAGDFA